jgi:peroxiredoxin
MRSTPAPEVSACRPRPTMYGKKYFGNERTTFIIDSDGRVAEVLGKVKPGGHDALVLAALAELSRGVL